MFKGPIEDRVAINELHQSYAHGVVLADAEIWAQTWAEEAHWSLQGMGVEVDGREAIVAVWKQAMASFQAVSFHCIPAMTVVDGDHAVGRCQTQEIMKVADGTTRVVGGLYEDEMVKRDGQWLYTSRIFRIIAEYNPAAG